MTEHNVQTVGDLLRVLAGLPADAPVYLLDGAEPGIQVVDPDNDSEELAFVHVDEG